MSDGAGALVGGIFQGVGSYLSARESRKAAERQAAINLAIEQRKMELDALQNTNREYDTAYSNIIGVSRDSLKYR